jgi:hypothetical protein
MSSSFFARARGAGASAAALMLALAAPPASAQEKLPSIEIGAAARKPKPKPTASPAPAPRAPAATEPAAQALPSPDVIGNPQPGVQPAVTASSERIYSEQQVTDRIYAQPQEALEVVPGLVVAQHSGSGKAAQYFLRGFALDHGYDIGITLDGMNVNQPSHVHSNGYADTNFLIPELLSGMDVRKGPYFADEGVFSSVGAVHMQYVDSLRNGLILASGGSFAWGRTLLAKSWGVGEGELLMALEGNIYNGPWERPDEARKVNGVERRHGGQWLRRHRHGLFQPLFRDRPDSLSSRLDGADVAMGNPGPDRRRQRLPLQSFGALERNHQGAVVARGSLFHPQRHQSL